MGERKGVNKHYPPDFDPALLPPGSKRKLDQQTVRMMLPMSLQCRTCGEFLYRGTKFNAQKETVKGELYLGQIKVFRFYMKCSRCKGEFTITTDPERCDYAAELNLSRNFEPWRDQAEQVAAANETRRREEEGDVMKQLENRTRESKRQLELEDALAEIRSLNRRQAATDLLDTAIEERSKKAKQEEKDEEDRLVQSLFRIEVCKRLDDEVEDEGGAILPTPLAGPSSSEPKAKAKPQVKLPFIPIRPVSSNNSNNL